MVESCAEGGHTDRAQDPAVPGHGWLEAASSREASLRHGSLLRTRQRQEMTERPFVTFWLPICLTYVSQCCQASQTD